MAASLDRLDAERKKAEEKFRALLESAPDAMVIVDADGRIVLVNAQTEKLFGYRANELLGQSVEMLVPERFREGHPATGPDYFATPRRARWARAWSSRACARTAPSSPSRSA